MSVPIFNLFPPELIADEYIRHNKDNKILYIFYDTKHKDYKDNYKQIFENETCKCAEMFEITTYDKVKKDIDFIINEQSLINDEKDCFMLLFLGSIEDKKDKADDKPEGNPDDKPNLEEYATNDRPIKDIEIWRPLANSQRIKYRPKIFIFHAFQEDTNRIQKDSGKLFRTPRPEPTATYEIPSEADVLIVYKKTTYYVSDCREISYFRNLTKNLQEFGHRDDLVNILTYTECGQDKDFRPLIVSTLRKKVYMTDSEHRSHWYDIRNQMKDNLKKLVELQQNVHKYLENGKISGMSTDSGMWKLPDTTDGMPKKKPRTIVRQPEPSAYTSIYYFVIFVSVICVFFSILVASIVK